MFTNHRDQRNRREALFTLETLDERLVLSATVAAAPHAAVVEARHDAHLARVEARHDARIDRAEIRAEARHDARLARLEARDTAKVAVSTTPVGSTSVTATAHAVTAATSTVPATKSAPVAVKAASSTATATTSSAPVATMNSAFAPVSTTTTTTTTPTTGTTTTGTTTTTPTTGTTTTTTTTPLPSNVSSALQALYSEYEGAGGGSSFEPSLPSDNELKISGTSVLVDLKVSPSTSFNSAMATLQGDGMQVTASSSSYGLIVGQLPIAQLPAAAQVSSSLTGAPPQQAR